MVETKAVNGLISMIVFKIPVLGITYTTGVAYIIKDKLMVSRRDTSLYNNPIGVMSNPIAVPTIIATSKVSGKSSKLQ